MDDGGFFVAVILGIMLAIAGFAGAEVMRSNIEDECQSFAKTNIRGKNYTCVLVEKPEATR